MLAWFESLCLLALALLSSLFSRVSKVFMFPTSLYDNWVIHTCFPSNLQTQTAEDMREQEVMLIQDSQNEVTILHTHTHTRLISSIH